MGTELTGFSYETGSNVTARVTYVSAMPATDRYSSGGNPNSSGYSMLLEVQGDVSKLRQFYMLLKSQPPIRITHADITEIPLVSGERGFSVDPFVSML